MRRARDGKLKAALAYEARCSLASLQENSDPEQQPLKEHTIRRPRSREETSAMSPEKDFKRLH